MNKLEKLTEATIKALEKRNKLNNDTIHIVVADARDDYYNNVDDAIEEYEEVYGSLMADDPYCGEYIFQPILDWLYDIKDNGSEDREYIVSQEEWDQLDELREEDPDGYYE